MVRMNTIVISCIFFYPDRESREIFKDIEEIIKMNKNAFHEVETLFSWFINVQVTECHVLVTPVFGYMSVKFKQKVGQNYIQMNENNELNSYIIFIIRVTLMISNQSKLLKYDLRLLLVVNVYFLRYLRMPDI